MGFFDSLKNAFGGGIHLDLTLPHDFVWEDQTLPVTLQLTNRSSETKTLEEMRFHFYDEAQGARANAGTENGVDYRWAAEQSVEIGAGATLGLTVQMPLPYGADATAQSAAGSGQLHPAVEKVVGGLIRHAMRAPTHLVWFRVNVSAHVEGAKFGAKASEKIRYRNAKAKISIGPVTL